MSSTLHLPLQQVVVSPQELDAIVARLNSRTVKDIKTGSDSSQAKAIKLTYQKDAAKGFKEVYVPVKRVQLYKSNVHIIQQTYSCFMTCLNGCKPTWHDGSLCSHCQEFCMLHLLLTHVLTLFTLLNTHAANTQQMWLLLSQVRKEEQKQSLCALADRCQENRKGTKVIEIKHIVPFG